MTPCLTKGSLISDTLPTGEILGGKNAREFLNEIIQKIYPENMKKIVGAVWKFPAK